MTYEEYDDFIRVMKKVHTNYIPTLEEIDYMETDVKRWMPLAVHLYNNGKAAATKDEKYRKKTLYHFIVTHLNLIEEDRPFPQKNSTV